MTGHPEEARYRLINSTFNTCHNTPVHGNPFRGLITPMTKLEQLHKAFAEADTAEENIEQQIRKYRRVKTEAFEAALKFEVEGQFGLSLHSAELKRKSAGDALREEADRVAKSGMGAKLPIGSRYAQWVKHFHSSPWKKTGIVAVVEVITSESQHPANAYYSRAKIGDTVLRLLKKDGTPGLKYARLNHGDSIPYGWYPEGTEPNLKTDK